MSLYHYQDENGKLQVSADLKNLLKAKGFKWKTVTNDVRTGQRVEVLECQNTLFKEQADVNKCVIYRPGLARENLHKEPFSFRFETFLTIGESEEVSKAKNNHLTTFQSIAGVVNNLMAFKRDSYSNPKELMS